MNRVCSWRKLVVVTLRVGGETRKVKPRKSKMSNKGYQAVLALKIDRKWVDWEDFGKEIDFSGDREDGSTMGVGWWPLYWSVRN